MKKGERLDIDFNFNLDGSRHKAKGTMFQVARVPQVYVAFERETIRPETYTFYKVDQPEQMFFWFDLHKQDKQRKAKAIARGLENYFKKHPVV